MKRLISGRKKSKKVRLRADSICTQPDFLIFLPYVIACCNALNNNCIHIYFHVKIIQSIFSKKVYGDITILSLTAFRKSMLLYQIDMKRRQTLWTENY